MLFSNKEHEGAVLPISIQNLYLLQTFWVYLTMSLLYERVLKMLPRINIILRFYQHANLRHILLTQDAIQHWYCNADNAAQWWYSTVWLETLVNLHKWYIQYFLVKMWVGVLITHT